MKKTWARLSFVFGSLKAGIADESNPDHFAREYWIEPPRGIPPRGVAVVAHGMNLRPIRMRELGEYLAAQGFLVLVPSFTGHHGQSSVRDYFTVQAAHWEEDANKFYFSANEKARQLQVPLYLVAYSFSALVFESLGFSFQKKVFFAPAFAPKPFFRHVQTLAELSPWFFWKSRNYREYRMNPWSSLHSVRALGHFLKRFAASRSDAAPALIWLNPEDELINFDASARIAEKRGWRVRRVSTRDTKLPVEIRHLMIDSHSLGDREWARVSVETADFLVN